MVFTVGQPDELDGKIRHFMKRGELYLVWNRITWRTREEAQELVDEGGGEVYGVLASWERMKPMSGTPARLLRRRAPIVRLLPVGWEAEWEGPVPASPACALEEMLASQGMVVTG